MHKRQTKRVLNYRRETGEYREPVFGWANSFPGGFVTGLMLSWSAFGVGVFDRSTFGIRANLVLATILLVVGSFLATTRRWRLFGSGLLISVLTIPISFFAMAWLFGH